MRAPIEENLKAGPRGLDRTVSLSQGGEYPIYQAFDPRCVL
jgi:hypothetical protein